MGGGRGGGGGVRKKRRREEKRRGDWEEKEGNACYNNPVLFTSADAGMKCKHSFKLFHEKPFFEFVELIGKISSRRFQFGEFRD